MLPRNVVWLVSIGVLLFGSGCTKKFTVAAPKTSAMPYEPGEGPANLAVGTSDARPGGGVPFSTGRLRVVLINMEDPVGFLSTNLEKELKALGIDATVGKGLSQGGPRLEITVFHTRNWRSSGFSPYWAIWTFSANYKNAGESSKIAAFYKTGKTPVMSFKEVEEPCYNWPVSLLVKEVAAKINQQTFNLKMSDAKVNELIAATSGEAEADTFMKVFELGFTNNPLAVPHLLKMTKHESPVIQTAAISAIGILRVADQVPYLKMLAESSEEFVKAMSLKALGDIGTPEAISYLKSVKGSDAYTKHKMVKEVIDLYL